MNRPLPAEDRALFEGVSRIIFSNPFSAERLRIEERVVGRSSRSRDELFRHLRYQIADALEPLEGPLRLDEVDPEVRDLVLQVVLFDAFHRHSDDFDTFIEAQERAGATPERVPFAAGLLSRLDRHGVPEEQAVRFMGIFYQMRRAYHFILRGLPGDSAAMRTLRERLWTNVFTHDLRLYERGLWSRMEDFSTMLLGETGTGKGTAAAAIGRSGWIPFDVKRQRFADSFTALFVPINLSQFSEALIESELFGHEKGAFTGAIDRHAGVFERCPRYGAIFLDEVGEVSEQVQIKLLRVLQERAYSPVGSHETRRFSGRVIAATNRSVQAQREAGTFRDDFYYRLCSDIITVPTLRERIAEEPGELRVLLEHIIARMLGAPEPELVALVEEAIARDLPEGYGWPGNVRELEQCVRRVILTRRYQPDAQAERSASAGAFDALDALASAVRAGAIQAQPLLEDYCAAVYTRSGSYQEAGRLLGLDRRTVRKHVVAAEERAAAGGAGACVDDDGGVDDDD